MPRTQWGRWTYEPNNITLHHHDEKNRIYEIDLERCRSSAEVLDRIMQIKGKSWATDGDVANLVKAFDDLLQPQATLCSSGKDKRIRSIRALLKRRGYKVAL